MRYRRCLAVAVLAAILGSSARAQPFEDTIPVELARALVSPGQADALRFHQGLPPMLTGLELPDGVTVLGSMEQRNSVRVVLNAPPDAARQREALVSSMEATGYRMLTQPPTPRPEQRGFIAPQGIPPGMPIQLCHDQHGTMMLQIVTGSRDPMIVLMGSAGRQAGPMNCAQQEARMLSMNRGRPGGHGAMQYMPRLELPSEASPRREGWAFSPFGRVSGSTDDASTESAVDVDWTPERLHEHFAGQLIEQGWTEDSSSAGTLSASSAWLREADDEALLGALQLLSSGEGQYRASFRVTILPGSED